MEIRKIGGSFRGIGLKCKKYSWRLIFIFYFCGLNCVRIASLIYYFRHVSVIYIYNYLFLSAVYHAFGDAGTA